MLYEVITFVNSQNIYVPESPAKPHEIIVEDNFKYINKDSFIKKEPIIKENIIVDDNNDSFNVNIIGEAFMTYIIAQVDDELLVITSYSIHYTKLYEIKALKGSKREPCYWHMRLYGTTTKCC